MAKSDKFANSEYSVVEQTKAAIRIIRGQGVILAADVARIYSVTTKRINERTKRHPGKFPPDFMFQLTKAEFDELRSQIANLINTDLADSVSVFVVRAFVEMRRTIVAQQKALVSIKAEGSEISKTAVFHKDLIPKLQITICRILDTVIDTEKGTTVKDEALDILKESIGHLKEQLKQKGLQNEEIAARVTKLLAEAENQRAAA